MKDGIVEHYTFSGVFGSVFYLVIMNGSARNYISFIKN